MTVRIGLAGAGAFGRKHLDALSVIEDAEVVAVVDDLGLLLGRADVDAVVLATPTPLHAEQAEAVLLAGKHVQVEIPLADSWAGVERVTAAAAGSGLVCMVGHTRRFNPSHRWVHSRIRAGELALQHLDVQTFFLRRTNINALGEPRTWTDQLLWHHAAHTVDLLRFQSGQEIEAAHVLAGPIHPDLGIAMDLTIGLRTTGGVLATAALSFNNDGPLGSVFRYIGDTGTYVARYDDLATGAGEPVDLSGVPVPSNGVEGQDREFVAAVVEGREPESSLAAVLESYRVLAALDAQL